MHSQLETMIMQHPTTEKLFVTTSFASGRLVSRRLSRSLAGHANFRPVTLEALISEWTMIPQADAGREPVSGTMGMLLIQEIVDPKGYFARAAEMPGLADALWHTLQELLEFEVPVNAVTPILIGNANKAREISRLLAAIPNALQERNWIDRCELLKMGISQVLNTENSRRPVVIIDPLVRLTPLSEQFLLSLGGGKLIRVGEADSPVSGHHQVYDAAMRSDHSYVTQANPPIIPISDMSSQISCGATVPISGISSQISCGYPVPISDMSFTIPSGSPRNPDNFSLFLGHDPVAELEEITRRIRTSGKPFEDIELGLASPDEQWPLLQPILTARGIPHSILFSQPIGRVRAGRAALLLCDWASRDFPASLLLGMLEQGDIDLFSSSDYMKDADSQIPGHDQVIDLIRRSHAIGGRQGYPVGLQCLIDENEEKGRAKASPATRNLKERLEKIIDLFPERATPGEAAKAINSVYKMLFHTRSAEDGKNRSGLLEFLTQQETLTSPTMPLSQAMAWLGKALETLRFSGDGKPEGSILVTGPESWGRSGRHFVFFSGLSHQAIPGQPMVDPILSEQARLGLGLPGLDIGQHHKQEALHLGFRNLPPDAQLHLSASLSDATGRAQSPAATFLHLLRAKSGQYEAPLKYLIGTTFCPRLGREPSSPDKAVFPEDICIVAAWQGMPPSAMVPAFSALAPTADRYMTNQAQRIGGEALLQKGLSGWKSEKYDYRQTKYAISPSRIESLSGCPYGLFVDVVLRCWPVEDLVTASEARNLWLDHFQRGDLLHQIFERFMKQAGSPVGHGDRTLLERVTKETIERFRTRIPPENEAGYLHERERIERDANFFFDAEMNRSTGRTPQAFEIAFGETPLGQADCPSEWWSGPVTIETTPGVEVHLKGRIDRLDESPEGWWVIDYKTGQAKSYLTGDGKDRADLQLAVYAYAMGQLSRRMNPPGKVAGAILYFPTRNGAGTELPLPFSEAENIIRARLNETLDVFSSGKFHATGPCDECRIAAVCPYKEIVKQTPDSVSATQEG
ncbi:MAG: PD-(D/E)XK nuclease family protein [Candidatus Riflebacteria bacterium]|nr:PD-(D/E)XK nuclease family protein [Candidatus Riflebacteria bacterium]